MRNCLIASILLSWLFLPSAASGKTTIVVDSGSFSSPREAARAEAEIDWLDADSSDDAACTQSFAAVELERYLRQMTGCSDDFAVVDCDQLPASGEVILVGRPTTAATRAIADKLGLDNELLASLGPQAYCIKSALIDGRRLTVVAGQERLGTLYGAYDLLYRLGCRWFAPGDLHEEVPQLAAIPDLDVTEEPSFVSRGFLAWENRGDADFLLWMTRNRLNYWTLAQEPHCLMHKLGISMVCGRHDSEHKFLNPHGAYPYDHSRFTGDESKLRDPYPGSPDFQGDADGDGQLSYFEAHPEWYPLVKGRRVPGIREERFGTNYCTSNPHATAEFVKNFVQALVDGPLSHADIVRFWTLDAGKWCECEACRAQGTPTDRYLHLVHAFCREIDKARAEGRLHRRLLVTFLTYSDVVEPPTRPLPENFPPDYCMATFYPYRRCYVHCLDDPACARNDKYCRQLVGWTRDPARHYRGQLAIGEYYNISRFKCLPICFMQTMANDIPYYYRAGARTFDYMHVNTSGLGSKALTNYQMARQLWDVRTDCEALWSDYFARRYGPAAATMRRFYESLEPMFSNADQLKYSLATRLDRGMEEFFPTDHLRYDRQPGVECKGPTLLEMIEHGRRCRQLLDEARALDLPSRVKVRIDEDERCFEYGERTLDYYNACIQAYREARAGHTDAARPHYEEARRLAELLRRDRLSTQTSSSHANAENALVASGASDALDRLAELLDAKQPNDGTVK